MVYLHVPFCKSFCTYCDFYSEICTPEKAAGVQKLFAERVCREIDERRDEIASTAGLQTLYIGGGTPSVLDIRWLRKIVRHLEEVCGAGWKEFTVEVNPEDIVRKGLPYARGLVGLGVGRVSMGVQSFSDPLLRWMNRRHNAATAVKAAEILREAGVGNLSLDLIFGISQLSDEEWQDTIEQALKLHPQHISAYQLSIEPGSALAGMVARGQYREAGEELCRRQYERLCERLAAAGFRHYEISNFARPGFEALHNSAYWVRLPYVGLGPGAHSFDGGQTRSWNSEGLTDWTHSSETLSDEDVRTETLMLGLRTAEGVPEAWLRDNGNPALIDALLAEGSLVRHRGASLRIPEERFFISDEIIRELV